MAYNFQSGQKIIIHLNDGDIIEGEFVSSSGTRLDIKNCLNTYTHVKDPSTQHFYQSEIFNIKAFELDELTICAGASVKITDDDIIPTPNDENTLIKITEHKYNELKALNKNYIYMATMDAQYYEAVNAIINTETIGTATLSSAFGRAAPVELLVISTWNQIYLFDISIYNCKQFPKALKTILQSEDVVKVVHDSRELVDCMYHQYKIHVNNIFDTYVATEMVSEEKLNLSQCLSYYFNIPEVLTKEAMDPKLKPQWKERPLDDNMKQIAAKNVQYLITLRNYLQNKLLNDFHQNVAKHSRSTLEQSHLDAQISLGCLDINKS